jgi:hypothetical protein
MKNRLHSLGNLTALPEGINRSITNKRFEEKITLVSGDATASAPHLQSWLSLSSCTTTAIVDRTHELIMKLVTRWPDPT